MVAQLGDLEALLRSLARHAIDEAVLVADPPGRTRARHTVIATITSGSITSTPGRFLINVAADCSSTGKVR